MTKTSQLKIENEAMLRWLPENVRFYLRHTETGEPIRAIARAQGVHASTILRQVRKTEARREDPMVDSLLTRLGESFGSEAAATAEVTDFPTGDDAVGPQLISCMRMMIQPGAFAVVGNGVDTAVVLKPNQNGDPVQQITAPRWVIEMIALRDWATGETTERLHKYWITAAGRQALNRMMARNEAQAILDMNQGRSRGVSVINFDKPTAKVSGKSMVNSTGQNSRPSGLETPVRVLGRAKSGDKPYLSSAQVQAAERFLRDFSLGQYEMTGRADYDALIEASSGTSDANEMPAAQRRQIEARRRFLDALQALGKDLAEVALDVCCYEKGMERLEAERHMPARSGKYMLRVAINYLIRHYDAIGGSDHDLIY